MLLSLLCEASFRSEKKKKMQEGYLETGHFDSTHCSLFSMTLNIEWNLWVLISEILHRFFSSKTSWNVFSEKIIKISKDDHNLLGNKYLAKTMSGCEQQHSYQKTWEVNKFKISIQDK